MTAWRVPTTNTWRYSHGCYHLTNRRSTEVSCLGKRYMESLKKNKNLRLTNFKFFYSSTHRKYLNTIFCVLLTEKFTNYIWKFNYLNKFGIWYHSNTGYRALKAFVILSVERMLINFFAAMEKCLDAACHGWVSVKDIFFIWQPLNYVCPSKLLLCYIFFLGLFYEFQIFRRLSPTVFCYFEVSDICDYWGKKIEKNMWKKSLSAS